MGKKIAAVDAYIGRSEEFAQPVLEHLRLMVHSVCPGVEEAMKWSFPHFMYKGMLCSMAAFKQHVAFSFWKQDLVVDQVSKEAMGQFGRIHSLADLPSDRTLVRYLKRAVELNDKGVRVPRAAPPKVKKALRAPADLAAALKKNRKALATFEGFNYTNKKDYVEWLTEAKTAETRRRRLATAVEWMAEGKIRNWKYVKK